MIWKTTNTGKSIPVDAEPVRDGNLVFEGKLAVTFQPLIHGEQDRYVSHFATCPQADWWRRDE